MTSSSLHAHLSFFGFAFGRNGVHTARTMMLNELHRLFDTVSAEDAEKEQYITAIVRDNCLGKRSEKNRHLTCTHLVTLYSLDCRLVLFRTLRFFWHRDPQSRPLLAALICCACDELFRRTLPFLLALHEEETYSRRALEEYIEAMDSERFSPATRQSVAQNLAASWGQAGYLTGSIHKRRSRARPGAGAVSYALLLGYLAGVRGELLLQTPFARFLDCAEDETLQLARDASRKGWLVCKQIGNVIDVNFSNLLTPGEQERLCEQDPTTPSELLKLYLPALA